MRVDIVLAGHDTWRAAVIARQPRDAYLASLVLVATRHGPRVADVLR